MSPAKYKRQLGSRRYKDYSNEFLEEIIQQIREGKISARQASEIYGICRKTLFNKMKGNHSARVGAPCIFTEEEEMLFEDHIIQVGEFGFPVTSEDLHEIVKIYLTKAGRQIEKFHKGCIPGKDWIYNFLKRHPQLSYRFASNIKRSRAKVDMEELAKYINNLERTLEGVDPSNVYNYNETNLADDPGKKRVIVKRGSKYPEAICNSSKSSTSIMLCGNATGTILPCYIVYKSTCLWDRWIENGPPGCKYDCTPSGWFDTKTFQNLFSRVFMRHIRHQAGPKVLIGDNLSSHISTEVLELCKQNNIRFVCLPPNSTHLTQPLDVAFFGPMKRSWRKILRSWKETTSGRRNTVLPKEMFPILLKRLMLKIADNGGENLRAGFKKCGIVPISLDVLVGRLPGCREMNKTMVKDSFKEFLKGYRTDSLESTQKKRRKIRTKAGVCLHFIFNI